MMFTKSLKGFRAQTHRLAIWVTLSVSIVMGQAQAIDVPGDQPTLNAAAAVAVANDTINLTAAGPYVEHVTFTVPVTITSALVTPPVVDGQIRLSAVGGSFTVSNIQVSNQTDNAFVHGIHVVNSTGSTVLVDNCILSGNFQDGVRGDSNDLTLTVQNCSVNSNMQRGVRYDGNYNGGPTTGAAVTVDNCDMFDNGLANNVTNNNRGRCVEMVDNLNGSLSVLNSILTMTSDGTVDRGIQYDNGNLAGTSLTVINCDITAPLWDNDTLLGNRDGGAIRVNADMTGGVTIEDCNIIGFNDPIRLDGRNEPTSSIVVRNCTVNDYTSADTGGGTAILCEDIQGGGTALVENVQMIALPGSKDIGGGNEALKIRDCDGLTMTVRGIETANTEEALTVDDHTGLTLIVEDVSLNVGSGEGEQAFKFIHNANTTFTITGGMADGWRDALDYGGDDEGPGAVSISFDGTTFTNCEGLFYEPFYADYGLSLSNCLMLHCDGGLVVDADDPGATNGTVEVSNCTVHDTTGSAVFTSGGALAAVTLDYNIFSDYSGQAIGNDSTGGSLSESFNVFADGDPAFGGSQAGAIVHGGGSVLGASIIDVYCNAFDELNANFLLIKDTGPAFMIDGSNNAGAFPACVAPSAVGDWMLYN
jgi:hypothetical protein